MCKYLFLVSIQYSGGGVVLLIERVQEINIDNIFYNIYYTLVNIQLLLLLQVLEVPI